MANSDVDCAPFGDGVAPIAEHEAQLETILFVQRIDQMKTHLMKVAVFTLALTSATSVTFADWRDTPAARDWAIATGHTMDPSSQVIVVDGGILQVTDTDQEVYAEVVWVPTDTIEAIVWEEDGVTAFNTPISLRQTFSFTSGVVVSGDGVRHDYLFLQNVMHTRAVDRNGDQFDASKTFVLPVRVFIGGQTEADAFMADLADAVKSDGSKGEGGIECFDPTWIGNDGQQCCAFLASYRSGITGCNSRRMFTILGCGTVALGGVGWAFFECAKLCTIAAGASAGTLGPVCMVACLAGTAILGFGAAYLCVEAADALFDECCSTAQREYFRDLGNAGCEVRKPKYRDSTGSSQ